MQKLSTAWTVEGSDSKSSHRYSHSEFSTKAAEEFDLGHLVLNDAGGDEEELALWRSEAKRALDLFAALDIKVSDDFVRSTLLRPVLEARQRYQPFQESFLPSYVQAGLKQYKLPSSIDILWTAICTIFSRPYFRRVWMIQEVAMAPMPRVLIGKYRLTWDVLLNSILFYKVNGLLGAAGGFASDKAEQLDNYRDLRVEDKLQDRSLTALFSDTSSSSSTDPRDKIFAVLGLVANGEHLKTFKPDYNHSVLDVYEGMTKYIIKTTQTLEVLSFADRNLDKPNDLKLPSWTPDWRFGRNMTNITRSDRDGAHTACSPHDTVDMDLFQQSRQGELKLKGKFLSRITHTSVRLQMNWGRGPEGPRIDNFDQTRRYDMYMMVFDIWMGFASKHCGSGLYPYARPRRRIRKGKIESTDQSDNVESLNPTTSQIKAQPPEAAPTGQRQADGDDDHEDDDDSKDLVSIDEEDQRYTIDAFWRTLVSNMLIWGGELTPAHAQDAYRQILIEQRSIHRQDFDEPMSVMYKRFTGGFGGRGFGSGGFGLTLTHNLTAEEKVDWGKEPSFWTYAGGMNVGRRMFVDGRRRLGTGRMDLRSGDWIVVSRGSRTPVVLREVDEGKERTNDGIDGQKVKKYRYIGPAYVHGIMKGEGMAEEGVDEVVITLV